MPLREPWGSGKSGEEVGGLERTERGSSNTRQRETLWLAGHENAKRKRGSAEAVAELGSKRRERERERVE